MSTEPAPACSNVRWQQLASADQPSGRHPTPQVYSWQVVCYFGLWVVFILRRGLQETTFAATLPRAVKNGKALGFGHVYISAPLSGQIRRCRSSKWEPCLFQVDPPPPPKKKALRAFLLVSSQKQKRGFHSKTGVSFWFFFWSPPQKKSGADSTKKEPRPRIAVFRLVFLSVSSKKPTKKWCQHTISYHTQSGSQITS